MAVAPQRTAQGSPSVLVEPGSHASAGQAAMLRVHARNISGRPQDFAVSAVGLEGSWLPAPVVVPGVPADATATFELTLTPPVGAAPGNYPFVVTVEARSTPGAPAATTLADGSLRVDGASDLVLTVEPADSQALRSRKVQVVLANTGDQPVRVRLDTGSDAELAVELGDGDLDVGPHQTVRIPGRVRARRPRIVGHARRTAFHVTATGARAPQRFDGTVSLRAVFTPALLRFVAVAMVAVLWIGVVLAVLPWVSAQFGSGKSDKTASSQASSPSASTGGSGSDGSAGTGTQNGSPAGPVTGKDGGTAAPAAVPGVRVAGIVTGSAPAGVVVSVQPASALSTATDASAPSSTPPPTAYGLEKAVTALLDPSRALAAAVVGRIHASAATGVEAGATDPPVGKVLATSLPVERTDQISQRRSTVTEDNGTWAFADLSPTARYLIVLAKPGYQTQRFLVTGAQAAAAAMKVAMVPGKGTMSGLISGPSGPAGGVEITLSDGTTTVTTRSATSGRVGYWEVDGLSTPSTYLVSASGDKLGAQSTLVSLAAAATRTVNLSLSAGVATLSGTASGIDSLGGFGGLGGLTVTATSGGTTRTATTVTGDRAGTFVLPDLPVPASYTVTISGDGYATQTRQIDLTAAGISPIDVSMTATGGTVQGTVTEPGGHGIAGAGLVLDGPSGTYKTMSASDATGTFRFSGIEPGQYVLTGEVFAHATASAQVTVTSGGSATADLVMAPVAGGGLTADATIEGSVRDASTGGQLTCPNGPPGEVCTVTISADVTDAQGNKTTQTVVSAHPDTPYHFPDLTQISGLLPGLYRLTISAPGYEDGHVNVIVPMGKQDVEATTVALEQSPSIVGTVQARVGAVPADTCVIALRGPNSVAPLDTCSADGTECVAKVGAVVDTDAWCDLVAATGSYSINRLASGLYDVWVEPPAGSEYVQPDRGTVALVPGSSRRFDALIDRLGVLSVTVMRSDGTAQVLPAEQATVSTTPVSGDATTTPPPATTNKSGFAQVRGLGAGVYKVTATLFGSPPGSGTSLDNITVGLNQEVTAQIVTTTPVGTVFGRVGSQLFPGTSTPIGGAKVDITGTTGFSGLLPVRTAGDQATTAGNGSFAICSAATPTCPTDGSATILPLVESRVDVHVTAPGYEDYTATDVPTSSLGSITLSPQGTPFRGKVTFDPPLNAADTQTALDNLRFTVLSAPPGVGQLSLTAKLVNGTPTIVWIDSAQGADATLDGARLVRPGSYQLAATLPGYDSLPISFVIQPGHTMDPITFTMNRYGSLSVAVTAQDGTTKVEGAIVTITLPSGATQQIAAHTGDNFVEFGNLSSGTYPVTVRAPGYASITSIDNRTVVVAPGQTDPQVVQLQKLGALNGTVLSSPITGVTEALPGALVTATSNGQSFTATTGTDGSYRVTGTTVHDGLADGTWDIGTTAAGHAAGHGSASIPDITVTPPTLEATVGPITMVADPGELRVLAVAGTDAVNGLTMQITYRDVVGNVVDKSPDCFPGAPAPCVGTDGLYEFHLVAPLTYNLNISGGSYSALTLPVSVGAGETKVIKVPVTTPAGSVQGSVVHQAANGGSVPVVGATVSLKAGTAAAVTKDSDANGQYNFPTVVPGTYTLSTTSGGLSTSRTVTVQPGQGIVVDLVLTDITRQVVVTVTSVNNTDLSGALVSLTNAGETSPPAAQPVVRTGAGKNTYVTTFNQVPAVGTWNIAVSGPSGHLGTSTGSVDVAAPTAPGAGPVTAAVSVTETQIALRATTSLPSAPSSVTATITQGSVASSVVVFVGGGDTVVFVPAIGATVTGGTPPTNTYPVTVTGGDIAANDTYQLVTLDVAGLATATTASGTDGSVDPGGTFHASGKVTSSPPGGGTVSTGTLQLERQTTGSPSWVAVGNGVPASGGNQALTAPVDASFGTGTVTLRVAYYGAGAWTSSQSTPFTVTVRAPSTLALSPATVTTTVTATVTPAAATGTVDFYWDDDSRVAGCRNVAIGSDGTAVCTFTQPKADSKIYAKTNLGSAWIDSTATRVTVTGTG